MNQNFQNNQKNDGQTKSQSLEKPAIDAKARAAAAKSEPVFKIESVKYTSDSLVMQGCIST